MKAKEWVLKLQQVSEEEFFKEFGEETAKLVAERTKKSKPETRLPAAEGAVREQRTKFRVICLQVPTLKEAVFDEILNAAVPDYQRWVQAAQKKSEPKSSGEDDVAVYRKEKNRSKPKKKENLK